MRASLLVTSCSLLLPLFLAGCPASKPEGGKPEGAAPSAASGEKPLTTASVGSAAPSAASSAESAAGSPSGTAAAGAKATGPKEPLNVLLITIDSLREDRMPWAGYSRKVVPNLAKLAEESVVYDNAYSVSSYTAQSVATFLTGRYASTLYRSGVFFTSYSESNVFISEILKESGVRTMAWHAHGYFGLEKKKNLSQGFDVWELVPGINFDPNTDKDVTSDKMTALGKEILGKAENTGKQFFAWAHFMDPHDEYKQQPDTETFGKKAEDRYDSEIQWTDKHVGELLDWARKQAWWDKTAVIISADHGEAFGEHGRYKHAFDVYEVLHRVPFILRVPGAKTQHIKPRRSHIDLVPTVLELMGKQKTADMPGESLVPELYGAEPKEREAIILELTQDSHNPQKAAVIKGNTKLMNWNEGWKTFLYDLEADPQEKTDLAEKEPAKLKEMLAFYEQTFAKIPRIRPYGGNKLKSEGTANGPKGPAK